MKGNLKSQTRRSGPNLLDFCTDLSTEMLLDMLQQAGLDEERDVARLRRRANAEGLGFFTKTLPKMGKDIQYALQGNRLTIRCFKKMHRTAIPHFLKGLLSRVFSADGFVRDDACITSITDLLQFCLMFYKLEVPYDPETEERVLKRFEKVDQDLPSNFRHLGSTDVRLEPIVLGEARNLITRLLKNFSPESIRPKHGPGAVATGEQPHEKMQFKRIFDRVEEFYPAADYYFLGKRHLFDEWDRYWSLDHVRDPIAKVVLVPKDSRGPRLISCEPLELQYIQQGLGRKLVAWIEGSRLTRGHVNFTSQLVNRKLALAGSIDGSYSTLDLSDASDRVSLALVKTLFKDTVLLPYLLGTRSTFTKLPNGKEVKLRKFAPMGSALCFPVEAICFWALAVACVHVHCNLGLKQALKSVYVYGDDIVVRGGQESALLQNFHYYGLRLNKKKCCYTGHFRESCGCDAFKGEVITPIKVKRLPPCNPTDGATYTSWIEISNSLFQRGYYRSASYTRKRVEAVYGKVPFSGRDPHRVYDTTDGTPTDHDYVRAGLSESTASQLKAGSVTFADSAPAWYARIAPDQLYHKKRKSRHLHRDEFLVPTVKPVTYFKRKGNTDWSELFRHLMSGLGTRPYQYTFLRRVQLKRRWVSLSY